MFKETVEECGFVTSGDIEPSCQLAKKLARSTSNRGTYTTEEFYQLTLDCDVEQKRIKEIATMPKKLIIFGNGLGMAIDPDKFKLASGTEKAWEYLNGEEKLLLDGCLPDEDKGPPTSENQLDRLHRSLIIYREVKRLYPNKPEHLLNAQSVRIEETTNKFIYNTAAYFYRLGQSSSPHSQFQSFAENLCNYIRKNRPHIATLNYDGLLYEYFAKNDIFGRYDTAMLVDGFWNETSGFSDSHLDKGPNNPNNFGWYMHLHGSPLFYEENQTTKKINIHEINREDFTHPPQVVLTHIEHKPSVIADSDILRSYWSRLNKAISQAQEIILFGYSGCDTHLNDAIKDWFTGERIRVIHFPSEQKEKENDYGGKWHFCKRVFASRFINQVEMLPLKNILNFSDWEGTNS